MNKYFQSPADIYTSSINSLSSTSSAQKKAALEQKKKFTQNYLQKASLSNPIAQSLVKNKKAQVNLGYLGTSSQQRVALGLEGGVLKLKEEIYGAVNADFIIPTQKIEEFKRSVQDSNRRQSVSSQQEKLSNLAHLSSLVQEIEEAWQSAKV